MSPTASEKDFHLGWLRAQFGVQVGHVVLLAPYQEIGLKSADTFTTGSHGPEALLVYIV